MWPIGFNAKTFASVLFVLRVIAIEPHNLAVAFKGQNVRGYAVKEPTVVANHHSAAGKAL
jgi:hypothetical protein